jgi:uncharacterized membrane protein YccC
MILILYSFVVMGAALLVTDLRGRLTGDVRSVSFLRSIGIAAASIATIGPVAVLFNSEWAWPYPLIPAAYIGLYAAFLAGTRNTGSVALQRISYFGFLALSAIPSWELLFLAPAVGLAGVALVRSAPSRVREA